MCFGVLQYCSAVAHDVLYTLEQYSSWKLLVPLLYLYLVLVRRTDTTIHVVPLLLGHACVVSHFTDSCTERHHLSVHQGVRPGSSS